MIKVTDDQVREAKEGELLIVERSARTPASPSRLKPGVYYRFKGATRSIFQFIQQSGATAWGSISGSLNDQADLAAELNARAKNEDLAAVATSGSYDDLSDKPTIPTVPTVVSAFANDANYQSGAQVAASLLPFLPLVSYYGNAGHTGDTNETPVLTFEIQPEQWLNKAMYQVICDCTRAAGTVTYQIYLNTSPVVAGGLRILGYPGTAASINLFRHFSVDGNNIRHNANTAALTTDIGATANVSMTDGTLDRTVAVFIVVTVTGNGNTSNGAFKNIQIGLV
jgi:hypothetical protein